MAQNSGDVSPTLTRPEPPSPKPDRQAFLLALLEHAEASKTFNPHFRLSEMLTRLNIDEGTFNILRYQLGAAYCHFVDMHDGEARYAISLSDCLALKEQYDQEALATRRHRESIRVTILVTILGAVLAAALVLWFTPA